MSTDGMKTCHAVAEGLFTVYGSYTCNGRGVVCWQNHTPVYSMYRVWWSDSVHHEPGPWNKYTVMYSIYQKNHPFYLPEESSLLGRCVFMQYFHFRIINRVLPCNVYFSQIKVKPNSTCSFCNEEDDLIHFLLDCDRIAEFWSDLVSWLKQFANLLNIPSELLEYNFLFGTRPLHSDKITNYILLLGKYYIEKTLTIII